MRDRASKIFQAVSIVFPAPANLTGGERRPERIQIIGVSPNYFDLLFGAKPQLGRLFDSRDIAEGFAEATVISDGLRAGASSAAIPGYWAARYESIMTFTPSLAYCQ